MTVAGQPAPLVREGIADQDGAVALKTRGEDGDGHYR
jgi:hypothetical protein